MRGDASSRIADACAWPGLTRDAGRSLVASKGGGGIGLSHEVKGEVELE